MKKILGIAVTVVVVLVATGLAMAQWGPGMGGGGRGMMMGRGAGGAGFGPGGGPCMNQQGGSPTAAGVIDEAKAKEIAAEYVAKNLPGYQVEKLVKFDRPRGAMYQAEVKGPKGELQYLHINPFGFVRSFGAGRTL